MELNEKDLMKAKYLSKNFPTHSTNSQEKAQEEENHENHQSQFINTQNFQAKLEKLKEYASNNFDINFGDFNQEDIKKYLSTLSDEDMKLFEKFSNNSKAALKVINCKLNEKENNKVNVNFKKTFKSKNGNSKQINLNSSNEFIQINTNLKSNIRKESSQSSTKAVNGNHNLIEENEDCEIDFSNTFKHQKEEELKRKEIKKRNFDNETYVISQHEIQVNNNNFSKKLNSGESNRATGKLKANVKDSQKMEIDDLVDYINSNDNIDKNKKRKNKKKAKGKEKTENLIIPVPSYLGNMNSKNLIKEFSKEKLKILNEKLIEKECNSEEEDMLIQQFQASLENETTHKCHIFKEIPIKF